MDVKTLVSQWNDEEREKLGPLIEECLEREKKIKESGERGMKAAKMIPLDLRGMAADLFMVHLHMEEILEKFRGAKL